MTQISLADCIHIHSSDPVVPIIISKWLWWQQTLSSGPEQTLSSGPDDLSTGTSLSKAMGPSGSTLVNSERWGGGGPCLLSSSGMMGGVLLLPQVLQTFKSNCLSGF